ATARVRTLCTPAGGSTVSRATSGAAVEGMRTRTVRPEARTWARDPAAPANSTRVKPSLWPMRTTTGAGVEAIGATCWASAAGIGASAIDPAAVNATEVLSRRLRAQEPDIPRTLARGGFVAVNER